MKSNCDQKSERFVASKKILIKIDDLSKEKSTEMKEFGSLYFREISRGHDLIQNLKSNILILNDQNQSSVNVIQNNVSLPKIYLITFNLSYDKQNFTINSNQ